MKKRSTKTPSKHRMQKIHSKNEEPATGQVSSCSLPEMAEQEEKKLDPFVINLNLPMTLRLYPDQSFEVDYDTIDLDEMLCLLSIMKKNLNAVIEEENKNPKGMTKTMLVKHTHAVDVMQRHINELCPFILAKRLAEKKAELEIVRPDENDPQPEHPQE